MGSKIGARQLMESAGVPVVPGRTPPDQSDTGILEAVRAVGTPSLVKTPLLAIDVPPKALVWEDDQGKVWLSYNSSDYLYNRRSPRRPRHSQNS